MNGSKGKHVLHRVFEGLVSIALVLIFFVVLNLVFNAIFPEGSGLRFIFDDEGSSEGGLPGRGESSLRVSRGDEGGALDEDGRWAATLVRAHNLVKSKKANDIAWRPARRDMKLGNQDAVQTLEESSALIRFDAENFIDLGENSLIVIRRMERDFLFREKRSFMVVVDGELRGRIGGNDEEGVYLEVETPNAVARLKSTSDTTSGIEFKIDVLEDASSAVTIYSGAGEVEAGGKTVLLERNQLTRVEGEGPPSAPMTLAEPVSPKAPGDKAIFPYRSLPPQIRLDWSAQDDALGYHLVLAGDADFTDILVDRVVPRPEFVHGNLHEGEFFWKVSCLNTAGEGAFGPTRRFTLIQDQTPPELDVRFPPEKVRQPVVDISGRTEPEARVFVSGIGVATAPDGSFHYSLALKRGINLVVIESIDQAGNVTYRTQTVDGKY